MTSKKRIRGIAGEIEGGRGEGEFVARIVLWESVRCEEFKRGVEVFFFVFDY